VISLDRAFTYTLEVTGPLESTDGSAADTRRQFWQMTRATLRGPNLKATSALPGMDWFSPQDNGFGRPHVMLPFHTDDGALLMLEYRGVVQATAAFKQAVANDTSTDWSDQYMRMSLVFDTTSPRYAWLRENLFLARGRLLAAKKIEYDVYRVG